MDQLISKYLEDDLTPQEEAQLKTWLEEDSLNRQVFENMVGYWKLSDKQIISSKQNVFGKVVGNEVYPIQSKPAYWKYLWRVAAILILAIGLGYVFNQIENEFVPGSVKAELVLIEKEAQFGQKLTLELPDGSVVKLNSGSRITYPKEFAQESREVSLSGEAFFDVTKDPSRPFRITTDLINISVLGTSFNVRAYENTGENQVAVKTGKVAVGNTFNKEKILLLPDELVTISTKQESVKKDSISNQELVFGWLDQTLMFEEDQLEEIIKTLERWYDVKISVQTKLDTKKTFTAKYKNPSLKAVLESLSYAYEFEYVLTDRIVTIK
ncbi:MAG: FecR family protein [Marinoscillum sp.]